MDLTAFFAQVPGPHRRQGPRKMAPFWRSNAAFLTAYFNLRHGLPSYGAFRDLLQALAKDALAQAFGRWFTPHIQAGDWVAGDRQSLRSTVRDAHGTSQSFASVVSLYCQCTGLMLAVQDYTDKKTGELAVVRDLLTGLRDQGVVLTPEALHAPKNSCHREQRQRLRAASQGQPAQAASVIRADYLNNYKTNPSLSCLIPISLTLCAHPSAALSLVKSLVQMLNDRLAIGWHLAMIITPAITERPHFYLHNSHQSQGAGRRTLMAPARCH